MAGRRQGCHQQRGDSETSGSRQAGRTTGDREYSRTRRDGSAVAQQRLEGRSGPYAGESGQSEEVAAAEAAGRMRVRLPGTWRKFDRITGNDNDVKSVGPDLVKGLRIRDRGGQ